MDKEFKFTASETRKNLLVGRNQPLSQHTKVIPLPSNLGLTKKVHCPTKSEISVAFSPHGYIAFNCKQKNEIDLQEGLDNNNDLLVKVDKKNPKSGNSTVKLQSSFHGFNSAEDCVLEPEMVAKLATSYDFPLSVYCNTSPDNAIQFEIIQLEQALNACETNRAVAMRLGLHSIAAMWSSLTALIPSRLSTPQPHPSGSPSSVSMVGVESTSSASFPFVLEILSSLLLDFLEGGDVLHVVVMCETLRSSRMLDAVVASSKIAVVRIRQAYMAYIRLLKNPQISLLTKADTELHSKCGACFKELSGDCAWCTNCRKYACKCVLCHKPIRGLLHWRAFELYGEMVFEKHRLSIGLRT
eukprot:gene25296-33825_t